MCFHCKDRPWPPKQKIANKQKVIWRSVRKVVEEITYLHARLCHSRESGRATVPVPNLLIDSISSR
jgi:hypothetical protein